MAAATASRRASGRDNKAIETKAENPLETKDSGAPVEVKDQPKAEPKVNKDLDRLEALVNEIKSLESKNTDVSKERHAEEKKSKEDPLSEQKQDRIIDELSERVRELKSRYDDLELKSQRPQESGSSRMDDRDYFETKSDEDFGLEVKSAWQKWARSGDASEIRDLEVKTMTSLSDPNGGYFVYPELDREINSILLDSGGFREIARVRTISTSQYKKRARVGGVDAGWIGERDSRARTGTPQYEEIKIGVGELYARPAVTQTILEDAAIDIESEIAQEVADAFMLLENDAFLNGDGSDDKPRGILTYPTQVSAVSWGKFQHVISGSTSGIAKTNPGDEMNKLIDLQHLLKPGYRSGASWMMNDATLAYIRKLRDADGQPFVTTDTSSGIVNILGYGVGVVQEMPDIGSNSLSIGWGVWDRTYTILDRLGSTMERFYDSNTAPYVEFYTRKRVGGGVEQFETAKFMKFTT